MQDLSSDREDFLISEPIETSNQVNTYLNDNTAKSENNSEIVEIYTQKLLKLQQSLNENFPDSLSPVFKSDINNLTDAEECCSNNQETIKLKFKNLFEFKKDIVIRKLLKTIDLMNIELSKYLKIDMTHTVNL